MCISLGPYLIVLTLFTVIYEWTPFWIWFASLGTMSVWYRIVQVVTNTQEAAKTCFEVSSCVCVCVCMCVCVCVCVYMCATVYLSISCFMNCAHANQWKSWILLISGTSVCKISQHSQVKGQASWYFEASTCTCIGFCEQVKGQARLFWAKLIFYVFVTHVQALQAPASHENMIKVGGYILGEFGNLIAGDPRSRYALCYMYMYISRLGT